MPSESESKVVKVYAGYTEDAQRLVFDFQDKYDASPHLLTVLPTGTVENDKVLKPEKDKGLIAYTYPQSISPDLAEKYIETPFVQKRDNGTFSLVQTWTTSYNDKFRSDFNIQMENPNPAVFVPQAVDEFKQAMVLMFGSTAEDHEILYCQRATENNKKLYVGYSELLLEFLKMHPEDMEALGITELTEGGFITRIVDGRGKVTSKPFTFSPGEKYALHTKQGWETMACITLVAQFNNNRSYHEQISEWQQSAEQTNCEVDVFNF